ncbi:MAG TPA: class III poly(R)-hydroxyalkanoic acid synthase subunit PhaC [Ktedonobacteraceae bacterium]|jgi:polyhydroxyalkanoate synthase|nr:class III poly(R)-hydroxyalkanoic acid synthase subunit PhaC [Ktedonobacteraceae bacterium]
MDRRDETGSLPGISFEEALKKYRTGMQIILEGAKAETGQTPKEIIWTKNKARLYHYIPATEKQYPVPILLVYALINRPYVLDLMPGNSLVEFLVSKGFDVYMLDWGTPGDEDKDISFDNYVLDYIPLAIRKMLRNSHAEEFTLLGYCMGGTMTAMYAALFPGKPLRNLILLTAPIDFTPDDMGLFGLWTSEKYFNPDLLADAYGNVPGELIDTGNRMLKPVTNYVGTYVNMWERLLQDKSMDTWLAMSKWVNDGVPFPGAAFKQWIREFYQQNKLVKGEIKLRGRTVNLANITCPVLNIAGSKDHICTLPQAKATMRLIGSQDKEFYVIDAGHVGLLTGSGARKNLWPKIQSWLEPRSR